MKPVQNMGRAAARGIRWVLTDIDGTLTSSGKITAEAYAALWKLKQEGLTVIAVTGRPAGWGSVFINVWPIDGVITENGALSFYMNKNRQIEETPFFDALPASSAALQRAKERVLQEFPHCSLSQDTHLRIYDLAIDHAEAVIPPLKEKEVSRIIRIFEEEGCHAMASSVHVNAWLGSFNKCEASVLFLKKYFSYMDSDSSAVLYVGDALNDEPMFAFFENACAVANIREWIDAMTHLPAWIASADCGAGFAEIVDTLILKRNQPAV